MVVLTRAPMAPEVASDMDSRSNAISFAVEKQSSQSAEELFSYRNEES